MSERHLSAIRAAIAADFPHGCRLIGVTEEEPGALFKHARSKSMGSGARHVAIRISGWGPSLEARGIVIRTVYDPTIGEDVAAHAATTAARPILERQRRLSHEAGSVGLESPLDVDGVAGTRHLLVDPDAVATLVGYCGSGPSARAWLDRQMAEHAAELRPDIRIADASEQMVRFLPEDPPKPIVRVVGPVLHLPFALNPVVPARGADGGSHARTVWEDDGLYLGVAIPITLATGAMGMTVDRIVTGTPIGGRRILSATVTDDFGIAMTTLVVEARRARVDDLLPR